MHERQFAINSISTSGRSLEERIDAYAEAGFKQVEFALQHVKQFLSAGGTPEGARRLLDDRGLVCIGAFETHLAVFADSEPRAHNHRRILENAELIRILGGKNLVVGTDGPAESVQNPLEEVIAAFGDVAGGIAQSHVNLLLEFNWSPIVKSLRTAVEVAQRCGAENAGVLFDSAHYHCTPTKLDQIRLDTVRWIKGIHVNDMRDKPGELSNCNSDRELPGEGHLNLREIFGKIEEFGYTGPFCIEMFSDALWELSPKESARRMYESMKSLI